MGAYKRNQITPAHRQAWVIQNLLPMGIWVTYLWLLVRTPLTTRWLDFPVYWEAGKKALMGASVYDVIGHFQYKYSPLIALLFGKAFQSLSFEPASWIFQKGMLFLWLLLFLRFAGRNFRHLFIVLLFFGNALRLDIELGQINALVIYLLALLSGSLERESSWREDLKFAFLFSIAVQLKLFCLVLVPLLLLQKEWRKLGLGVFFIPLLSIGGVAVTHGFGFAFSENRAWIASLTESTDELLLSSQNVALLGTAVKVFGLFVGKSVWMISGLAFLFYLFKNRGRPIAWFRNRLLYSIAVFNPLVWSYWILFAIPLFTEKLKDFSFPTDLKSRALLGIGALFVFAAFNGQHATWAWNGGIFGALVLLGIVGFKKSSDDRLEASPHVRNKLVVVSAPRE